MASSSLQICALLLALAGFTMILVTTISNRWKLSDTLSMVAPADWISEGLWMDCAVAPFGLIQCKKFLYMMSSESKCARHMYIKSKGEVLFLLPGQHVGWLIPMGAGLGRICGVELAGRLKGSSETHMLHPAIQLSPCCGFFAICVVSTQRRGWYTVNSSVVFFFSLIWKKWHP